jgi:hypothetical protein
LRKNQKMSGEEILLIGWNESEAECFDCKDWARNGSVCLAHAYLREEKHIFDCRKDLETFKEKVKRNSKNIKELENNSTLL